MASGIVNYTNFVSQSYENIKSLIDNKTNVPDPISTTSTRKMVYTREPDQKARGFSGYPYIIVPMPSAHFGKSSLDGSRRKAEWEIVIEVHSSDVSSNSGSQYLRDIADDIIKTLNNVTNRTTLRNYGMANVAPNFEPLDPSPIHQEMVYMGRFTIPFSKYITVSV